MRRYVFGLGTGRCGSTTLAHVLNSQMGACVTHEAIIPLPWNKQEPQLFDITLNTLAGYPGELCGDVALYYIRYVYELLSSIPSAKFVCLQRDLDATVQSYINHCQERYVTFKTGEYPSENSQFLWHYTRPKYYVSTQEDGIRLYYNEYYTIAKYWESQMPDAFKIFSMEEVLNDEKSQRDMLEWIGLEEPVLVTNYKLNQGES